MTIDPSTYVTAVFDNSDGTETLKGHVVDNGDGTLTIGS